MLLNDQASDAQLVLESTHRRDSYGANMLGQEIKTLDCLCMHTFSLDKSS